MPASEQLLDNLPWNALTGPQQDFAEGAGMARRYRRPFALFSAVERLDRDGWTALGHLVKPGGVAILFQPNVEVDDRFSEVGRYSCYQMVADGPVDLRAAADGTELVELGADDAEDMVALTSLTEPGPFFADTYQLGTYLGVREDGRLIAMAGERLRAHGAAEISAVCTHPDARRRGLAAQLTSAMVDVIQQRGDLPLLHVAESNVAAIPVYEQLGFRKRCLFDAVAARYQPDGPPEA